MERKKEANNHKKAVIYQQKESVFHDFRLLRNVFASIFSPFLHRNEVRWVLWIRRRNAQSMEAKASKKGKS